MTTKPIVSASGWEHAPNPLSLETPADPPAALFATLRAAARRAPAVTLAFAVVLVAVIGWVDSATGEFSITVLYFAPVALATWYAGLPGGWCVALLSAGAWLLGDRLSPSTTTPPLIACWNAGMLALVYGVVVWVLWVLRRLQHELVERVRQRTVALAAANADIEAAMLRFIEMDKLESLGGLAAGIAHEVKNPLMTITMVTDYLAEVIPPGEPEGANMIRALREATARASRVISEMLDFAAPSGLSLQPGDFHAVAERTLELVKLETNRKRITVARDWCEPAPALLLDRNKLEQVLINILMNAVQAMPEGGRLTVRTRVDATGFTAEVDDTGPGLTAAQQARLFEPFFTTKPPGQGTGLGLSVARRIMQLQGGSLHLTNQPDGGGARVTIQLPLAGPRAS